jgi:hypothetical protein
MPPRHVFRPASSSHEPNCRRTRFRLAARRVGVDDSSAASRTPAPASDRLSVLSGLQPNSTRNDWACPRWFAGRVLVEQAWQRRDVASWRSTIRDVVAFATALTLREDVRSTLLGLPIGAFIPWAAVVWIVGHGHHAPPAQTPRRRPHADRRRGPRYVREGQGQWHTRLLLSWLGDAPPAALSGCERSLAGLSDILEHVERMVPQQTTPRIQRGVQETCPGIFSADFRSWIEAYDEKHLGRLNWHAASTEAPSPIRSDGRERK